MWPMIRTMFGIFTDEPQPAPPTVAGSAARRRECGYAGVTVQACEARGCVFDTTVPHSPWCYYPSPRSAVDAVGTWGVHQLHSHGGEL